MTLGVCVGAVRALKIHVERPGRFQATVEATGCLGGVSQAFTDRASRETDRSAAR